jgi:ABC-type transporter Mla MlaB component
MAVLLDWLTFARSSGRSLHYRNLPAQVEAMARISEVLALLEGGV